jgi:hypothetical protein
MDNFNWLPLTPSDHLIRSFNWYQNRFGHYLTLTGFVTQRQHGERSRKACRILVIRKNQTRNYLLSQGRAIREIVQEAYVILATLENATQGELTRYENNYKALNIITTALGRNVYDHVSHLETTHDVWLKLCNTYEGSSEIKSSRKDTYNRQYQTLSQKPRESLDDCFARFESIVSSLRSCGPLAYSDNECAKQLLYALNDHVWGMKITVLEESTDFATLDTKKLFIKFKSHELSRKGRPNHDASLFSVIPSSKKEGTKPPYVCPRCSNHTYSNNMITRFYVQ